MKKAIAKSETGMQLENTHFSLAKTGLNIAGEPAYEDWASFGEVLSQVEGAVHWWIGDWVNYGEAAYGATYSQALDETRFRYQTIANDAWVAGRFEFSRRRETLPWTLHAEVAGLEATEQDKLLDQAVKESWSLRELRQAKHSLLPPPPLPEGKYCVIYADPPWEYDFAQSDSRQIEKQYRTMEVEAIKALLVGELGGSDAVLFLWATSPKLKEALDVIEAWGFEYKTCMVWVKDKIGMGYYARQMHEMLLIAKRGEPPMPEPANRPESIICAPRLGHSEKPDVFYEIIEQMYPGYNKIELFAREHRKGWTAWGDQVA